jgi:integrase/recombinase XerD
MKDLQAPKSRRHYVRGSSQCWTDQEIDAFFRAISDPRDVAIFEVARWRGLRASEIGMLTMSDLSLRDGWLIVHRLKRGPKDRQHFFSSSPKVARALKAWIRIRGAAPGPLFPSRNSNPISRQRLDALTRHYGELAGLPESKRHFHAVRHTAGTNLAERLGLLEAQDALGHRDPRSTMVYVESRSKRRREVEEKLTW